MTKPCAHFDGQFDEADAPPRQSRANVENIGYGG